MQGFLGHLAYWDHCLSAPINDKPNALQHQFTAAPIKYRTNALQYQCTATLSAWILLRESPRIDDLDKDDVGDDDEGWEVAEVHPLRDLDLESDATQCYVKRLQLFDRFLILTAMQCNMNGSLSLMLCNRVFMLVVKTVLLLKHNQTLLWTLI